MDQRDGVETAINTEMMGSTATAATDVATQTDQAEEKISLPASLHSQPNQQWTVCGERMPKNQVVYFTQIFFLFSVMAASIVQLAVGNENKELWVVLLCTCTGYILPNPKLKFHPKKDASTGGILSPSA